MAQVSKWSNVAVAVQSALAAALTISGITKASPGVVTYVGADPANGDYVKLTVLGMFQLDGVVARVANVNTTANTFELEGFDTTLYDSFTSGSFEVITFGTSLTSATTINASGGDFDFIDTTTIHDNVKKQIPGLPSPGTFTMDLFWDPSDAGFVALKAASDNQAQRAVRLTFANGQKVVFVGYIGASGLPTGNAQDTVKTSVVITMFGKPTIYSA
jgi:hypothetical protein